MICVDRYEQKFKSILGADPQIVPNFMRIRSILSKMKQMLVPVDRQTWPPTVQRLVILTSQEIIKVLLSLCLQEGPYRLLLHAFKQERRSEIKP